MIFACDLNVYKPTYSIKCSMIGGVEHLMLEPSGGVPISESGTDVCLSNFNSMYYNYARDSLSDLNQLYLY